MDTVYWILLCFGIGVIGTFAGYTVGTDATARVYAKMLANREEVFQEHFKKAAPHAPLHWYWWTGREDRKEFIVGVVAHDEGEARMKLDPQRMPLIDKARASGVKEVGLHVLVAHSREEINVQAV